MKSKTTVSIRKFSDIKIWKKKKNIGYSNPHYDLYAVVRHGDAIINIISKLRRERYHGDKKTFLFFYLIAKWAFDTIFPDLL
jgi:hypothetical protein